MENILVIFECRRQRSDHKIMYRRLGVEDIRGQGFSALLHAQVAYTIFEQRMTYQGGSVIEALDHMLMAIPPYEAGLSHEELKSDYTTLLRTLDTLRLAELAKGGVIRIMIDMDENNLPIGTKYQLWAGEKVVEKAKDCGKLIKIGDELTIQEYLSIYHQNPEAEQMFLHYLSMAIDQNNSYYDNFIL